MKLLYTIILLFACNLLFAQDTLKSNFPTYFISQIEIKYELIDLENIKTNPQVFGKHKVFTGLHKTIKPFSPNEFPPYFDLELSAEDIIQFQSGFEIEALNYFLKAENNLKKPTSKDHYSKSSLIISTNFDTKESSNFYHIFVDRNAFHFENKISFSSLIYQREEFIRSAFSWNLKKKSKAIHFNISHINNLFYRHLDNTSIFFGDRRHVFFPEKYHEKINNEWTHSSEIQNQNTYGTAIFAKLFLSPFKKTYLKIESDWYWFLLKENKRRRLEKPKSIRQRFRTLGIGVKPWDGTTIFLEYTNRKIGFDQGYSFLLLKEEKPYYSLNVIRVLKLRLFKR